MKKLTGKQLNHLRGLAHHRKIVVSVGGAGITKAVINELNEALEAHELVKIRIAGEDKKERQACLERLCSATDSAPVQLIGRTGIAFRTSSKNLISLP